MKTDPICGMAVDEAAALQAEREGKTYYFCSEHCREKFLEQSGRLKSETARHVSHHPAPAQRDPTPAGASAPAARPGNYVCPMHPEVVSDRPDNCPKCGMALEPARPAPDVSASARETVYTCPMHPEVQQDRPGSCP